MNREEFLAKLALEELRVQNINFPPDVLELAIYYVQSGYGVVKSISTYNPLEYATPMAEAAVVEYVKAKLTGQPVEGNTPFNSSLSRWTSRAALEYSKRNYTKDATNRIL